METEPNSAVPSEKEVRDDSRVSLNQRRSFIVRNLRARGMISLNLLARYFGTLSSSSLQGDIEFLRKLGFSIEAVEAVGRRYLVDSQARHLGAKIERTELHADAKYAISATACALLLGIPPTESNGPLMLETQHRRLRLQIANPELEHLPTTAELRESIVVRHKGLTASHPSVRLWQKLARLWDEAAISVFCDSGSTNEKFGQVLRDVFLPTSFSALTSLQVCTNSKTLFNILADPEVCTKAVITGGLQLGVDGATDTLAGPLTNSWITATEGILPFSICFVGATAVDLTEGFFLSDSYDEKTLKQMIMSQGRSKIRVIVIDRSKLDTINMREGFRFASISPEQVDLIIVDALPHTADVDGKEHLIERIRNVFGVPVIEAIRRTSGKEKPLPAILRGREFRTRVSHEDLERLLDALERSDGTPGSGSNNSGEPPIPPKFVSHFVELFLNAAIQEFFDDSSATRERIKARFNALAEESFLGKRESSYWEELNSVVSSSESEPKAKTLSRQLLNTLSSIDDWSNINPKEIEELTRKLKKSSTSEKSAAT